MREIPDLEEQTFTVVQLRGRDYIDLADLERAISRWAEAYEANGRADEGAALRRLRDTLAKPLIQKTVDRIALR